MLDRFLLLWLLLSSAFAYAWPQLVRVCPPLDVLGDPFIGSKPILPWLIGVTMFAIGLMLPRDEVRQVLRRWPTVLGGTAIQYSVMPTLAYCIGRLAGLEGETFIGVVMVGCVPGAMASNVLTLNARGNASYSVSLTTTATILSPLIVPLVLQLILGEKVSLDVFKISRSLFLTVVAPVVSGHLLGRAFPDREAWFKRAGPVVANVAILWIIAAVVGLNRERLGQAQGILFVALLGINLGGFLAGYLGGRLLRLPASMSRALTLEVGMQNAGLGATLALQIFPDQAGVAIAPAMYTFGCMLTGAMLARFWARTLQKQPDSIKTKTAGDDAPE